MGMEIHSWRFLFFQYAIFGFLLAFILCGIASTALAKDVQSGRLRLAMGAEFLLNVSGPEDLKEMQAYAESLQGNPAPQSDPEKRARDKEIINLRRQGVLAQLMRVPEDHLRSDLTKACEAYLSLVLLPRLAPSHHKAKYAEVQLVDPRWRKRKACRMALSGELDTGALSYTYARTKEGLRYGYVPIGVQNRLDLRKPMQLYLVEIAAAEASSQVISSLLKTLTAHLIKTEKHPGYYGFNFVLKPSSTAKSRLTGLFVMVAKTKEGTLIDFKEVQWGFSQKGPIADSKSVTLPLKQKLDTFVTIHTFSTVAQAVLEKQQAKQPYKTTFFAQSRLYLEELGVYAVNQFKVDKINVNTKITIKGEAGKRDLTMAIPVIYQRANGHWRATNR